MATGTNSEMAKQIVQAEQFDQTSRIVNATAATLTMTKIDHDNKTVTLNRAAGIAVTLPAATGSGVKLRFVVGTTVTSNNNVISRAGSDVIYGIAIQTGAAGATTSFYLATAVSVTMNGTTTGGRLGEIIELEDIASGVWSLLMKGQITGTAATPFA